MKNLCTIDILSYPEGRCLVLFVSNVSCVRPKSVSVLARIKKQIVICIILRYCVVQRGTQQENSATKGAFTGRSWAKLGRVNEVSFRVMFICKYKLMITAKRICEGNDSLAVV